MGKSKAAVAVQEQFIDYKSVKDMAYNQAKTGDSLKNQAQYAMDHIAGFPTDCSDADRAELNSGYDLRFMDNNPEVQYAKIEGNYIKIDGMNAEQFKDKEKVAMNAMIAMSYTTHEFGRLNESHDPQYKAIVKEMRDRVSDYRATCFKALKTAALKILNAGKTRERGKTKTFSERVEDIFNGQTGLSTNVRNAAKRGDPTANEELFRKAKVAFFAVWNHAE